VEAPRQPGKGRAIRAMKVRRKRATVARRESGVIVSISWVKYEVR
jgi:hypothetical protein